MEKLNIEKKMLTVIMVVAVAVMMVIPVFAIISVEPSTSAIEKGKTGASLTLVSSAPTEPLNLSADPGNEFVWLWWDHPLSQGSDLIKNYTIYRSENADGSNPTKIVRTIGPSEFGVNFYNDTNVINGTIYYYQLTADSDAGSSALSGSKWISATPTDVGSAPSGPQNLVVQNLTYSVQLNWSLPSTNGTTPVRFYDIIREENGTTTHLLSNDMELWTTGYHDEDSDLLPGHTYNYTVRAVNSLGAGPSMQGLHLGGTGLIPGAPENLTADAGNHTVYLSWDLPANPSFYGITQFNIYRNVTGGSTFVKIEQRNNSNYLYTYFTDSSLINGIKYTYVVTSVNGNGESGYSNQANATPTEPTITPTPYVPYFLNAYPGNNQVLLTWSTSFDYKQNVTNYAIFRSRTSGVEADPPIAWLSASQFSSYYGQYYDNSTTNGLTYYYTVRAINNVSNFIGPMSVEASATPNPGTPPPAPTGLIATPNYYGVMLFVPEVQATSAVLGYEIWRANSSTGSYSLVKNVTNLPYLPNHLGLWYTELNFNNSVTLFYKVKAVNLYGTSGFSNVVWSFPSNNGDVPDPVTNLNAVAGTNKIVLTWSNPTYQGTANLLFYYILRSNGSGWYPIDVQDGGLGQMTFNDTSILSGQTYQYQIMVSNFYGPAVAGSNIKSASVVITPTSPSKPLNLETQAGNGYVVLTWDPPSDPGTSAITGYTVLRGTSLDSINTVINSTIGNVLTFNDTSVTNGQPYWYAVKATNSVGTGTASDPSSATPSLVPSPPSQPLGLVATPGNALVVLGWSAPSSSGSSAIIRYDIFRGNSSANISTTALGSVNAASALTYTDSSLINGQEYWYVVKAVNDHGSGLASDPAHAVPSATGTVPGAPTAVTAVGGPGHILVSWAAPANAGSGVSNYLVFRATTSGGQGSSALVNLTGSVLQYNDTSAVPGTPYFYNVRAWNPYGDGVSSAEVNATATATGLPSNPTSLTATPDKGKVIITWGVPTSDGGSAITGYRVLRGSSASTLVVIGNTTASIRSFTDEDVVAGTTYFYSVVAVNANGNSAQPTPVSAVPESSDGGNGTDNTWLYVGAGIAAVAVIGGVAYFLMRKKK